MPKPAALSVTVTKVIEARPETIYDLVADITHMPTYSPENVSGAWLAGASGAETIRLVGDRRCLCATGADDAVAGRRAEPGRRRRHGRWKTPSSPPLGDDRAWRRRGSSS